MSLPWKIWIVLTVISTVSCHNLKDATKANLKAAIQSKIEKHEACLFIDFPNVLWPTSDDKSKVTSQYEALVAAGLASKKQVVVNIPGSVTFGGLKELLGTSYELTADGRKYASPGHIMGLSHSAETLCYGVPEVLDIVHYTLPGKGLGQTITEVDYTYALKSVPSWTKKSAVLQQFPELHRIPTRDNPQEAKLNLVLTADGWHVATSRF